MQEEIKVAVTFDESALQAGLARATASVQAFEKKISKPRDVGLPAMVPPAQTKQMELAAQATAQLGRNAMMAGQGGSAGARGFLQLSYAIQDLQYGFRGVINNLPMIAQGFGGGAGLAGGLMLAAIAGNMLWPQIQKIYGAMDNDALEKGAEAFGRIFADGMKAANAIETHADTASRMADASARLTEAYRQRMDVMGSMGGYYDSQLASAEKERNLALEILAAKKSIAETAGADTKPLIAARRKIDRDGMESDMSNRRKELGLTTAASADLDTRRANIAAENTALAEASAKNLADLERRKAYQDAAAESAKAMAEATKGDKTESRSHTAEMIRAQNAAAAIQKQIDEAKALANVEQATAAAALANAKAAADAAHEKVNATNAQIEALERARKQLLEMQALELRQLKINELNKQLSESKAGVAEHEKAISTARSQTEALIGPADEMKILRETLNSGKHAGADMRDKMAMDSAAAKLAAEAGVTLPEALAALKEKADWKKKAEKMDAPGPTGTIKERLAARGRARDEERDRKRDLKLQEAQKLRDEKGQDGKKKEDIRPGKSKLEELLEKSRENEEKARKELSEHMKKQNEIGAELVKEGKRITAS